MGANEDEDIRYAREVVGKDPMAAFLGIEVEEVKRGYARLSLRVGPQHMNALERAHGMAISSLVDQAAAVASNSTGRRSLVVELKINFLDAVSGGDKMTAEATPLDLKRKLSLWQVQVKDGSDRRVALGQALVYHRTK